MEEDSDSDSASQLADRLDRASKAEEDLSLRRKCHLQQLALDVVEEEGESAKELAKEREPFWAPVDEPLEILEDSWRDSDPLPLDELLEKLTLACDVDGCVEDVVKAMGDFVVDEVVDQVVEARLARYPRRHLQSRRQV